jgi:uroporphyrin-III C-methyltransferase/precorrin-2 dehydrogenase/sirohydrochlorin ferrochelatase
VDALPPGSLTLVVLMGLGARAAVAARLLARGWPAATPSAVLLGAATPQAFTWIGPLSGLATAALPEEGAPGTLVVGSVAALAAEIGSPARAALECAAGA